MHQGRPLLSSVPLQISFNLNAYYNFFFVICEILLVIYKAEVLPYPGGNIALDVILIFLLVILEALRLFIGSKGNLTEHVFATMVQVGMIIPSALLTFYLLYWQTYVLRVDVVLCGVMFALQGFQLLLSLIALCVFSSAPK